MNDSVLTSDVVWREIVDVAMIVETSVQVHYSSPLSCISPISCFPVSHYRFLICVAATHLNVNVTLEILSDIGF